MNTINIEELESILTSRAGSLFARDIDAKEIEVSEIVGSSSFLVLGGAGSIGRAVVKEIVKRKPRKIHVVDINENSLANLTREIRSTVGYFQGEFSTIVCDVGSDLFESYFMSQESFDYVLNFTALKHVRSEKDNYSLARLIEVNIFNTRKVLSLCELKKTKKYFCVSTDKASAHVNFMGASKRIMEIFLESEKVDVNVSTARFANVAFSDGSLPLSMLQRLNSNQPITVPIGVKRFFVTHREAGELCLMSCLLGTDRDIFYPKLTEDRNAVDFLYIAQEILMRFGYTCQICDSEESARRFFDAGKVGERYPIFLSNTDTTGEKRVEQFYSNQDMHLDSDFEQIGVIRATNRIKEEKIQRFYELFSDPSRVAGYSRSFIEDNFKMLIPDFDYFDSKKSLDDKM